MNEESTLRVLQVLASHSDYSQRQLAATGFSLGKLNFILRALREKGLVKPENFSQNPNKLQYAYLLTPRGIGEKADLAYLFLQRKMREYEELRAEIEGLKLDESATKLTKDDAERDIKSA